MSRFGIAMVVFLAAYVMTTPSATAGSVQPVDGATQVTAWRGFLERVGGAWRGQFEGPGGRVRSATGSGIPWIPGRGNRIAGTSPADTLGFLEIRAKAFVEENIDLLGLRGFELRLDRDRSRSAGSPPYLWFLFFNVYARGVEIRQSVVSFTVNNGNLVAFSVEAPPEPPPELPRTIGRDEARRLMADLGAVSPVRSGQLAWEWRDGRYRAVWVGVIVTREGSRFVALSAEGGVPLVSDSLVVRGQATGGVHLLLPTDAETLFPIARVTVSDGTTTVSTDAAGRFRLGVVPISGSLSGPYFRIFDQCGQTEVSSPAGNLSFGAVTGTDCTTPFAASPGDTSASRTTAVHLARIHDLYRGYDGQTGWLDSFVNVQTNYPYECTNYVDVNTNTIFLNGRVGSVKCNNAGENAGLIYHEWAHPYQWNALGYFPDAGSRESYADVSSLLQLHGSCIAEGFLRNGWRSGEGGSTCTGFREVDFTRLSPPVPATPQTITLEPYLCQPDPGNAGILGMNGHCEGHISSGAIWELGQALAVKYGAATGWDRLLRLWIAASARMGQAWEIVDQGPPLVADGCSAWNWFEVLRSVDDDDGDLSNGVPDGAAIFAAFDNHGIACASDPFVAVDVATCPVISAPAVTLSYSVADDSETISWTPVPGATGYRVLRSELGPEGAFTPISTTGPGTTSFVDADGTALALHWYTVVALGGGNCESLLASVVRSTNCVPAVALAEPFAAAGVDPDSATLSWTLGSNATRYDLFLSTASDPGPYLQTAGTSMAVPPGSLAPGTTYQWRVAASNDAEGCPPAVSEVRSFTVSGNPAAPSLWTVEPGSGPAGGGTLITLGGANLYLGAAVTVGGLPATVSSWGDGSTVAVTSPPHAPGLADVVVTNPDGQSAALSGAFQYGCPSPLPLTIQVPSTAFSGQSGLEASVAEDPAYIAYTWTTRGGEIEAGQGTSSINFRAGMPGQLDVEVAGIPAEWCLAASPANATVDVVPPRTEFYTLDPCRVLDTRGPVGPQGGPSLQAGVPRSFPITGTCGIPAGATAVTVNVTVINPSTAGAVSLASSGFPSQLPTIVFGAGATRANFATVSLTGIPSGGVDVTVLMPAGTLDLIVDVSGFYR